MELKVLPVVTSTRCSILNCNWTHEIFTTELFTFSLIKLHFYIALGEVYNYFMKFRTFRIIFHREGKDKHSYEFNLYAYYKPHFEHNM
jgi:hypothetical protein